MTATTDANVQTACASPVTIPASTRLPGGRSFTLSFTSVEEPATEEPALTREWAISERHLIQYRRESAVREEDASAAATQCEPSPATALSVQVDAATQTEPLPAPHPGFACVYAPTAAPPCAPTRPPTDVDNFSEDCVDDPASTGLQKNVRFELERPRDRVLNHCLPVLSDCRGGEESVARQEGLYTPATRAEQSASLDPTTSHLTEMLIFEEQRDSGRALRNGHSDNRDSLVQEDITFSSIDERPPESPSSLPSWADHVERILVMQEQGASEEELREADWSVDRFRWIVGEG